MLWTEPATFSQSPIPLDEHAILAVTALCRCDLLPKGPVSFFTALALDTMPAYTVDLKMLPVEST